MFRANQKQYNANDTQWQWMNWFCFKQENFLFQPADCHAEMIPISLLPVVLLASNLLLSLYLCQLSPSGRQTVTSVMASHQKKSISYSLQAPSCHVQCVSSATQSSGGRNLNTLAHCWRTWTKLQPWGTAGGSCCLSVHWHWSLAHWFSNQGPVSLQSLVNDYIKLLKLSIGIHPSFIFGQ